ncbi:MAG: hypothetical protein HY023_05110, partial [Chloroflexi bacterium]|nr:hypothetical protein [Chloroflexota bacterium]
MARLLALFFAALFIAVCPLTLVLFNIGWQMFDPALYKRALAEQHIYERLPGLAADQAVAQLSHIGPDIERMQATPELQRCVQQALDPAAFEEIAGFKREPTAAENDLMRPCFDKYLPPQDDGGGGPPDFAKSLTPEQLKALLPILIPASWLKTQTESAIDQVFASLDSDKPELSILISFADLKRHLAAGAAVDAFRYVVYSEPPCTAEQLAALAVPLTNLPPCRPPEEVLTAIISQNQNTLSEAIAKIPDETDLIQMAKGRGDTPEAASPRQEGDNGPLGNNPREVLRNVRRGQVLRNVRRGLRLSPLLPAGLILLVTLFGVRSLNGWLRWWGIPFLIVGLIGVGAGVATLPAMNWAFATYAANRIPPTWSPGLLQTGLGMARQIVGTLARWIGSEAGAMGVIGLAMVVISVVVKPRPA